MAYYVRLCLLNVPHMKAPTFPQRKWEGGTWHWWISYDFYQLGVIESNWWVMWYLPNMLLCWYLCRSGWKGCRIWRIQLLVVASDLCTLKFITFILFPRPWPRNSRHQPPQAFIMKSDTLVSWSFMIHFAAVLGRRGLRLRTRLFESARCNCYH